MLLKNLERDLVLKGRGFEPRRKSTKSTAALAAEVALYHRKEFFSSLLEPPIR